MRKSSIILSSLLLSSLSYANNIETLDTISVESSTIDDRFSNKRTEVSSTSTINGEKVDDSHVENIQQVLQSIPGITTEVKTGDSLKIHIRGVENQMYMGEKPGVAIVIDGVPVFERTGAVNIDLDNIESIKVLKGGASYLFGDDALSGAVIITTKKGAKYNNNFAAVERGSFGYQKLLARTGYANDNLSFHIQGSERKADGYHEDSGYTAKYFDGKLQYYIDDSSDITFGTEYSERAKDSHGTVGGLTEALNNPKSIYTNDQESRDYTRKYNVDLLKLFLTYSKDFTPNTNLLVNAYIYTDDTTFWSSPQTRDGSYVLQPSYNDNDYVYDNMYEQVQRGIKSELRTSSNSFATLVGLDLRDNEYKNKVVYKVNQALRTFPGPVTTADYFKAGDEKSNDTTTEKVSALYGEYKQAFSQNLTGTANLRFDNIQLDYMDSSATSLDKEFNIYSYRLGSNYNVDDKNSLYVNYSTGFRAPTVSQLFAGDTSAWGYTQNNPDLKPEKSYNYEIGSRGEVGNINYEAALFRIDRKDFIMKSSGNYGGSSSTANDMWDNIGGAKHQGLELAINSKITDTLSYNMAYTYLDAKYTSYHNLAIDLDGNPNATNLSYFDVTGNRIPRTSKHALNFILDYQATSAFKLQTEYVKKSSYYADDLNRLKIEGQEAVNLLAEYKIKNKRIDYSFFARVDNLFDNQYFNTARASGDRNDDGVFDGEDLSITVNQGRTFTAGLSVKF
ncbi:MAG: TonB-dependent receptor [Candidatus Marinarcus sp.]|uniref:TonB-dependent receptor n=1 Tax=Candidatus Marinarcus sp. TaxID=3100987 RepID=UPI003B004E2B